MSIDDTDPFVTSVTNTMVDHPQHYGGEADPYEVIKVIEAWGMGFCDGNVVKYMRRAGEKPGTDELEDLEKARWYLSRYIAQRRVVIYGGKKGE